MKFVLQLVGLNRILKGPERREAKAESACSTTLAQQGTLWGKSQKTQGLTGELLWSEKLKWKPCSEFSPETSHVWLGWKCHKIQTFIQFGILSNLISLPPLAQPSSYTLAPSGISAPAEQKIKWYSDAIKMDTRHPIQPQKSMGGIPLTLKGLGTYVWTYINHILLL